MNIISLKYKAASNLIRNEKKDTMLIDITELYKKEIIDFALIDEKKYTHIKINLILQKWKNNIIHKIEVLYYTVSGIVRKFLISRTSIFTTKFENYIFDINFKIDDKRLFDFYSKVITNISGITEEKPQFIQKTLPVSIFQFKRTQNNINI